MEDRSSLLRLLSSCFFAIFSTHFLHCMLRYPGRNLDKKSFWSFALRAVSYSTQVLSPPIGSSIRRALWDCDALLSVDRVARWYTEMSGTEHHKSWIFSVTFSIAGDQEAVRLSVFLLLFDCNVTFQFIGPNCKAFIRYFELLYASTLGSFRWNNGICHLLVRTV